MYIYLINTHGKEYEIYNQKKDRINYVRPGVLKKTLYNDKKDKVAEIKTPVFEKLSPVYKIKTDTGVCKVRRTRRNRYKISPYNWKLRIKKGKGIIHSGRSVLAEIYKEQNDEYDVYIMNIKKGADTVLMAGILTVIAEDEINNDLVSNILDGTGNVLDFLDIFI